MMSVRQSLAIAAATCWVATQVAPAAVWYVSKAGNDSTGNGSSGNTWLTIQHAVADGSVSNNDEIRVGEGTYNESVTVSGKTNLTIKGGYNASGWAWDPANHPAVVNPGGGDGFFLRAEADSVIGFTITGGRYGVYNVDSINTRYTVSHCIISNNSSHGVFIDGQVCAVDVRNCLIVMNGGDGILLALDSGGGALFDNLVTHCTIAENGGSGYEDNHAYTRTVIFRNSIIAANGAYGIRRSHAGGYNWDLTIGYSCIYGNVAGSIAGNSGNRVILETGVLTAHPRLLADYRLASSSPCTDRGTDMGITNDLTGAARSLPYDMGCYESGFSAAPRYAAIYVDRAAANDLAAGTNWATAKKTIGSGLAATAAGGTCTAAAGTYTESIAMPALVTLAGADWTSTILSYPWDVATFAESNATIRELSLTGSYQGVNTIAEGCTVARCIFRNNTNGIVITRQMTINNCIARDNRTYGIYGPYVTGTKGVTLMARNTLVIRNGSSGVFLNWDAAGGNHAYFYNCDLSDNGLHGYEASTYASTAYFRNTLLSGNNGYASRVHTWGGQTEDYAYCCVFGNTNGTFYNDRNPLTVGAGMVYSDPRLVGGGDYHLDYGSFCIDAGTDLSASGVTNDLDLAARTNTADIGCYESTLPPVAKFATTYVNAARPDDSGAGTNWATAKKLIGSALAITTNGTCHVAAGFYSESVSMPANVTLQGAGRASTFILNSATVASCALTNSVIRDFTLQGGTRGVSLSGSDNTVERCNIVNCGETAVYIVAGNSAVRDCNMWNGGNGVYAAGNLIPVTIERCAITNNTGRGITGWSRALLTVRNCLMARNGSDGFYINVDLGGTDRSTYLYHCTMADNGGSGYVSAYSYTMTEYVRDCIVSSNAQYGIRRDLAGSYTRNLYLGSSCIYGNGLGDISARVPPGSIVDEGGMITNQLPQFQRGTWIPSESSPCVDSGIDLGITNDVVRTFRPTIGRKPLVGSGFDMGAYELVPTVKGTMCILK